MLSRKYQLLLIITILLSIYYPSLAAQLNSIDDVEMVTNLINLGEWRLKDVFLPGSGMGLYYRPLLYLTFVIDKELWFMEGRFLHLENILLHLVSAILVFFLAASLLPQNRRHNSWLPLIAALCFGLHPIATESVNWVSGRTDLLACVFVLASSLFLLKFKEKHKKKFLFISLFALLLGMLSKEVALLFLPGALFILIARNADDNPAAVPVLSGFRQQAKRSLLFLLMGGGALSLFFLMRSIAFHSNSSRIGMSIKFMLNDPVHTIFVFLRAFGFYFKKFFWPFPLNFAIVEVDPLYELLAMLVVLLCIYIAWRRTLRSAIFLAGIFMLVPSFPIAYGQVAWTPYAERYMYIATAFVVTASVLFLGTYLQEQRVTGGYLKAGALGLVIMMSVATFQRNLIWRTNVSLYTDTAQKSPTFTKAWNQLGIAYYEKNDYKNAEIYFAKASSLFELNIDEKSDLNLAVVLVKQGKVKEAEAVYANMLNRGGYRSAKVVDHYIGFLSDKMEKEKDPAALAVMKKKILEAYKKLYAANKDPIVLYKIGTLLNQLGDKRGARASYLTAYEMFPENDKYRGTISRQLMEMAKK